MAVKEIARVPMVVPIFAALLLLRLTGVTLGQTPGPTPAPVLGGPASILTTYDAETLRKGEFVFSFLAATVQTEKLSSKLMVRDISYRVILPPGYAANAAENTRFPVIYLLHGLSGHFNNWTDKTKLAEYSALHKFIIVNPEGDDGWYTDSVTKPNDKYESYIVKELIPEIDKKFRTLADRDHRAIAGLSMGGYGSIKFGLKYPEMFTLVGSFSGALGAASISEKNFPGAIGKSVDAIFGPADSATRNANDIFLLMRSATPDQIKRFPFLYLDCGTEDFLFQNNREFINLILEKKVPHEFRELPGAHDWKFWNSQVEEFLELVDKRLVSTNAAAK